MIENLGEDKSIYLQIIEMIEDEILRDILKEEEQKLYNDLLEQQKIMFKEITILNQQEDNLNKKEQEMIKKEEKIS